MWTLLTFVAIALAFVALYTNFMDAMFTAEVKKRAEVINEASDLQKSITGEFQNLQETGIEIIKMAQELDENEKKEMTVEDKIPS